jgi:hypothetical protein
MLEVRSEREIFAMCDKDFYSPLPSFLSSASCDLFRKVFLGVVFEGMKNGGLGMEIIGGVVMD